MKKQNKKKITLTKIDVARLDKLSTNRINGGVRFFVNLNSDEPCGTGQTSVESEQICGEGVCTA